jgi:hypothetical protein
MIAEAKAPLSNMQVELMKLYSTGVPDEYLNDIRILVAKFLFAKARLKADQIWDEKGYTDALINELIEKQLSV